MPWWRSVVAPCLACSANVSLCSQNLSHDLKHCASLCLSEAVAERGDLRLQLSPVTGAFAGLAGCCGGGCAGCRSQGPAWATRSMNSTLPKHLRRGCSVCGSLQALARSVAPSWMGKSSRQGRQNEKALPSRHRNELRLPPQHQCLMTRLDIHLQPVCRCLP